VQQPTKTNKTYNMKKISSVLIALIICSTTIAQFTARMEVKEPIKGICDEKNVYVVFAMFKDQEEARCPVSKQEITKRLNAEVVFLKDSSTYQDKGMVNMVINCKGEVVKCEIDNKTRHSELDQQIVAVFNSLGKWKPGKINGEKVDTSRLWSFKIKDGQISID
jgi:hypothetical protein